LHALSLERLRLLYSLQERAALRAALATLRASLSTPGYQIIRNSFSYYATPNCASKTSPSLSIFNFKIWAVTCPISQVCLCRRRCKSQPLGLCPFAHTVKKALHAYRTQFFLNRFIFKCFVLFCALRQGLEGEKKWTNYLCSPPRPDEDVGKICVNWTTEKMQEMKGGRKGERGGGDECTASIKWKTRAPKLHISCPVRLLRKESSPESLLSLGGCGH
jgi:hypothetical protein